MSPSATNQALVPGTTEAPQAGCTEHHRAARKLPSQELRAGLLAGNTSKIPDEGQASPTTKTHSHSSWSKGLSDELWAASQRGLSSSLLSEKYVYMCVIMHACVCVRSHRMPIALVG